MKTATTTIPRQPKSVRNITRFDYDKTGFQGWRLCITRFGVTFSRYFSDRQFGSRRKSFTAASERLSELNGFFAEKVYPKGEMTFSMARKGAKILNA